MTVAASALALDYVEVTGVNARQRYPWNGLVDVDFELDSRATEPYLMHVIAYDNVGKTNLPVRSVYTEGVSQKDNPCMVTREASRIVWDADADLPDGFKCTNVLVTCQDVRSMGISNLYMIIDISGGANAASYPVTYTNCPPPGGWTEEHKTTKLVLRRVEAGSFMMGSPATETGCYSNEDYHKVTLTKPYYIGVFEVTERQYAQVKGDGTGTIKPKILQYGDIRGNDVKNTRVTGTSGEYTGSKTTYCWPDSNMVDPNSFMGKLRAKTGVTSFDLPTEAQWECAARGGCEVAINLGYDYDIETVSLAGRTGENRNDGNYNTTWTDVTAVGCYIPNSLGLYDMLGNACEFCVDAYVESLGTSQVTDPSGGASELKAYGVGNPGYEAKYFMVSRVIKGGGYAVSGYSNSPTIWGRVGDLNASAGFVPTTALRCGARAESRTAYANYSTAARPMSLGFRLCYVVE